MKHIAEAERFCYSYSIDLDKFLADAVAGQVNSCMEDEGTMAYHLKNHRVPETRQRKELFSAQPSGVAALINEAANLNGKLAITVSFPITPEAFRVLLAGAAESGAPLEELVGTAVNRLVESKPIFTLPKLRNS